MRKYPLLGIISLLGGLGSQPLTAQQPNSSPVADSTAALIVSPQARVQDTIWRHTGTLALGVSGTCSGVHSPAVSRGCATEQSSARVLTGIASIQASQGGSRGQHAVKGAAIGLGVGAVLGVVLGSIDRGGRPAVGAVVVGAIGLAVGAVVGAAIPPN